MAATMRAVSVDGMGTIIRSEFAEMPGMRLTIPQVCRLWSLTQPDAEAIVRRLVARGFLVIDPGGRVCRPQDASD